MMPIIYHRTGVWTDVVAHPTLVYVWVRQYQTSIIVEDASGRELWRRQLAEESLYLRAVYHPAFDEVYVVVQGHDSGQALLVTARNVTPLGASYGENCVGIDVDANGRVIVFIQTSVSTYSRVTVGGDTRKLTMASTSQGWVDTFAGATYMSDQLIWTDKDRESVVGQPPIHLYFVTERAGVAVGQAGGTLPEQVAGYVVATGQTFTAFTGGNFEPHIAAVGGGTFAVCARQPDNVCTLVVVGPTFPPLNTQPTPVPVPTPTPLPVPPAPVPVPTPLPPTPTPKPPKGHNMKIAYASLVGFSPVISTLVNFGTTTPIPGSTFFNVTIDGGDDVVSIDGGGNFGRRPKGTAGPNETFAISGSFLVVTPANSFKVALVVAFVEIPQL